MSSFEDAARFKETQMRLIVKREHLTTEAELDAFLARDPKTKDSPDMTAEWKAWLLPYVSETQT